MIIKVNQSGYTPVTLDNLTISSIFVQTGWFPEVLDASLYFTSTGTDTVYWRVKNLAGEIQSSGSELVIVPESLEVKLSNPTYPTNGTTNTLEALTFGDWVISNQFWSDN